MASTVMINVQIPDATKALARDIPDQVMPAVKRGMDRALGIVRGRIQQNRLSGQGPFPPDQHRLGERSGRYRQALLEEPSQIFGTIVVGSIGVNLNPNYPGVHEFGAVIVPRSKPFLVFKIGDKVVRARKVTIPARAPLTTGVTENLDYIAGEIGSEIDKIPQK